MARYLVDIDEEALAAARRELGTMTLQETVNEALRRSAKGREERVSDALDVLAGVHLADREESWR